MVEGALDPARAIGQEPFELGLEGHRLALTESRDVELRVDHPIEHERPDLVRIRLRVQRADQGAVREADISEFRVPERARSRSRSRTTLSVPM